ncbi:MAG: hypothetical protein GF403_02475 [Candidatus Coatesbacteria bacterium]|nr:hypothetical protein [Candidatus Coatesbacteria bacterium]
MTERLHRLRLDDIAGPDAVGRLDGKAVFVRGGAPGDLVLVELISQRRSYAKGRIHQVLEGGPERVEPPCPHYGDCGGCDWLHLEPAAQLGYKAKLVGDLARKIARLEIDPLEVTPNEYLGYRDRARLQTAWRRGGLELGFYAAGSHHLVAVEGCPLWAAPLNTALESLRRLLAGRLGRAGGWHQLDAVELETAREGWALCLRFGRPRPPRLPWQELAAQLEGLTSLRAAGTRDSFVAWGAERIRLRTPSLELLKTTGVFGQPSDAGARWLLGRLRSVLESRRPAVLWDLYGGYGLLGRLAPEGTHALWLVESDPAAVEDAALNLRGRAAEVFITEGLVEEALSRGAPAEVDRPGLVILDPPRSGLRPGVLDALVKVRPPVLFYAACNPARFWRDARGLLDAGYRLSDLEAFDMAPQTHHLELSAVFESNAD